MQNLAVETESCKVLQLPLSPGTTTKRLVWEHGFLQEMMERILLGFLPELLQAHLSHCIWTLCEREKILGHLLGIQGKVTVTFFIGFGGERITISYQETWWDRKPRNSGKGGVWTSIREPSYYLAPELPLEDKSRKEFLEKKSNKGMVLIYTPDWDKYAIFWIALSHYKQKFCHK